MVIASNTNGRIVAIVPAAGSGTRMGDALPKQYLPLNDRPMILHTLTAMARVRRIERIVVVVSADDPYWDNTLRLADERLQSRVSAYRVGGRSRAESVANGLQAVADQYGPRDWALVHDAARPCIRPELIEQFLDELEQEAIGGLLALPVADTLKRSNSEQRVEATVEREALWRAQTPQMFRFQLLLKALAASPNATDEAQAMELQGYAPKLVIGESANLKVTYATDLKIARILLTENQS